MKLSPLQKVIIQHRLEVADAISDYLYEEDDSLDRDEIEDRCAVLITNGLKFNLNNDLDKLIFKDCCEGSTFFPCLETAVEFEEETKDKARRYHQAADRLTESTGHYIPRK